LAFFLVLAVRLAAAGLCTADEVALKLVARSTNKSTAIIDGDQVKISALSKPKGGGLALGAASVPDESGYNRGSLSGEGR
jgi:hypothetical protein